jgi:predicted DNA-binding transcriptional regulator YafY
MQIERLFKIIYMLLHEEKISANILAERLGVSRRTIYRDIDTLSLAGIPVYTEKGKSGGVGLLPDFVLNKSVLNEQEQNEILSALHGLSNITTAGTKEVLQKVSAVFNKQAVNWLEVDFSDWQGDDNYWDVLKESILNTKIIEFYYYNSIGEQSLKQVEPMQLMFKLNAWYLIGFCLTKQDERMYKLSRIKKLLVTSADFLMRPLKIEHEQDGGDTIEYELTTVKLHILPEKAYRVFDDFSDTDIEKQSDGSFIITMKTPIDDWLLSFILSYGKYIEVLAPEDLRATVKTELKEILQKY